MEIFQVNNGRASLRKGCKDRLNGFMKPSFPNLGAYSFNLRIAERIEASNIRNQVFPVSDQSLLIPFQP